MAGSSRVVYALTDAHLGEAVYVRRGETWAADDPVVMDHPASFTADPEQAGLVRRSGPTSTPVVEQATAEPGQRRDLPRRPRP